MGREAINSQSMNSQFHIQTQILIYIVFTIDVHRVSSIFCIPATLGCYLYLYSISSGLYGGLLLASKYATTYVIMQHDYVKMCLYMSTWDL